MLVPARRWGLQVRSTRRYIALARNIDTRYCEGHRGAPRGTRTRVLLPCLMNLLGMLGKSNRSAGLCSGIALLRTCHTAKSRRNCSVARPGILFRWDKSGSCAAHTPLVLVKGWEEGTRVGTCGHCAPHENTSQAAPQCGLCSADERCSVAANILATEPDHYRVFRSKCLPERNQ